MKQTKSFICMVLTLFLMVTVLMSACSKTKTSVAPSKDASPQVSQSIPGQIVYPLKDKVVLEYWRPMDAQAAKYIQKFEDTDFYKELMKRTGVTLKITTPTPNQEKEQFNLMVASNSLPDIIQGASLYKGGVAGGINDGVFLNLTTYLDQYAPDYKKLITAKAEIKRQSTLDDGSIGAFYLVRPDADPPAKGPVIRKDWLDELKLGIPETIADWTNMLTLFKEKKGAVAPLILPKSGVSEAGIIIDAFNVAPYNSATSDFFQVQENKVQSPLTQPGFKEYLTLMNDWYKKGLISSDFPSMTKDQANALYTTGKSGVNIDTAVGNMQAMCKPLNIPIVTAYYPVKNKGDKLHFVVPTLSYPIVDDQYNTTVVNSKSKYKEIAVQFLNYGYTQEGADLYNYGIEGLSYTKDGDKKIFTDSMLKNPAYPVPAAIYILKMHFGPKVTPSDILCNPNLDDFSKNARVQWGKMNYDNSLALPKINLTSDDNSKRTNIMNQISVYADEMILKFIVGQESIDKYDNFVKQLKAFGIDDAISLTQKAYDRYLNK